MRTSLDRLQPRLWASIFCVVLAGCGGDSRGGTAAESAAPEAAKASLAPAAVLATDASRASAADCEPGGAYVKPQYTIVIDDKYAFSMGPMNSSVALKFTAVSPEGLAGPYKGSATSKTTNEMSAAGGSINAPASSTVSDVAFTLRQVAESAQGSGIGDWIANGTVHVATRGTGTVSGGGAQRSVPLSNRATVPYELTVHDTTVNLKVEIEGAQPLLFKGVLRREITKEMFARNSHDIKKSERPHRPVGPNAPPPVDEDDEEQTVHKVTTPCTSTAH